MSHVRGETMEGFVERDESFLLVIDVQERLHAAMDASSAQAYARNCGILVRTASRLGLPVVVTEQYPKGLGPTIESLAGVLGDEPRMSKLAFSCMREEPIAARIRSIGRKRAIIAGIEAHVCVLQTAVDMMREGMRVVVASDEVCSRRASDRDAALDTLRTLGALVYPTETIAFMLLERAGTDEFKDLAPLFR
ncbi:MAG TPA: isochorismatase family protein [Deltaproteobacteria bacterium]|nr:isochorismatase family protein [Deltaproteobacteria bacterium]HPP81162.1 isochorismatase family protein [Deltaproteobacteria bacterium]